MNHQYHKPNSQLISYLRNVLVIEGCRAPEANNPPIFTNGMPTLLCTTETDKSGVENILKVTLFTSKITAECWAVNNTTTVVAYFFKPFALTSLFRVGAKPLIKNPLELSNWSPHKYNALKTQLVYADTVARKLEILDNLLIQQHLENQELYRVIQFATERLMQNQSNEVLTEILTALKLNERTFQRIFKKYVGVTATQYRRICQFQGSFDQLRSKQFDKVSDVAFDNGFADQSHFIRSFKEFTQTTPNDYLQNGLAGQK